jgi:hypothetical protein
MPVSTPLQHAYHDANSAALLPGCMQNRLWYLFALGWAESRFGIDFLAGFLSIVILSVIVVSLDVLPSLLSRHHLYCCANTCLIAPFLAQRLIVTFRLSSSCHCHHYDQIVVFVVVLLSSSSSSSSSSSCRHLVVVIIVLLLLPT